MILIVRNDGRGNIIAHKEGCRDLARERFVVEWELTTDTMKAVVLDTYPPDDFEYDPGDWENLLDSIQFKPCTKGLRHE